MSGLITNVYAEVTGPVMTADVGRASRLLMSTRTRPDFVGVLSIADPIGQAVAGMQEKHASGLHGMPGVLKLNFHDAEDGEDEKYDLCTAEDVQRILRWGKRYHDHFNNPATPTKVLVHCFGGIARSTASTFMCFAQALGPGYEQESIAAMLQTCMVAGATKPNLRMCRLADEALGRGGKLLNAAKNYIDGKKSFPYQW